MLVTELYNGQGLGNQLWCYVVTRVLALKNGYDFAIMSSERFKGREFIELDFGCQVIGGSGPEGGPPICLPEGISSYYKEITKRHPNGFDISKMDIKLLSVTDNSKIDGCMQSYQYIKQYKIEILNWIKINRKYEIEEDVCFIHIRGGDFKGSNALIDSNYYKSAITEMEKVGIKKFLIITDDPIYSKGLLPDLECYGSCSSGFRDSNQATHHIGGPVYIDFCLLNSCKNVIMSASSFSWWAVWLNKHVENVIAPKYWAANNISDGYWSCGDSLVDGWKYLHKNQLYTYEECSIEKKEYEEKNKNLWL